MIRKIIISTIIIITTAISINAATSATGLLDAAADRLARSKSIVATYRIKADGQTLKGNIVVSRDKFTIDAASIRSWFDGTTQWTYMADVNEVNVTEPTPEEIAQVNPFAIINNFRKAYKSSIISSSGGNTTIRLEPKSPSKEIKNITISIDDRTFFPSRIVITTSTGSTMTIDILSISEGQIMPDSYFRYDKKILPGVEVIDLR